MCELNNLNKMQAKPNLTSNLPPCRVPLRTTSTLLPRFHFVVAPLSKRPLEAWSIADMPPVNPPHLYLV